MSKNLKAYLSIVFILVTIIGCGIINPFRQNETHEDTYNRSLPILQIEESGDHTRLRNEMYKEIINPILPNSNMNSAHPSKMMWIQIEDGDWHISKI